MPQVFQVLCCYQCEMFQVQQVKKSNKWQCRGCNAKQSLKKAFKIGAARDCRYLVQELNMRKAGFPLQMKQDSEYSGNAFNEDFQASNIVKRTTEEDCSNQSDGNCDEIWPKDDYKCFSNSDLEVPEKSETAVENNFLPEEPFITETSCCKLNNKTGNFKLIATLKQHEPVIDESLHFEKNAQKRPIDNCSLENNTLPPFKKNKGFQIILNAASKLNK